MSQLRIDVDLVDVAEEMTDCDGDLLVQFLECVVGAVERNYERQSPKAKRYETFVERTTETLSEGAKTLLRQLIQKED